MDQVFLDNFINKLNDVINQLSIIASNKDAKNADQQPAKSIISSDDQQQTADKANNKGDAIDIVDIQDDAAKKMVDKFVEGFSNANKDNNEQIKKTNDKISTSLDIISKSSTAAQQLQEKQLQQKDIEELTKRENKNQVYIAGINKDVAAELVNAFNLKQTTADKKEGPNWLDSLKSVLGPMALLLGGGLLAFAAGPGVAGDIGKLLYKLGWTLTKKAFKRIYSIIKSVFNTGFDALKNLGGAAGDLIKKIPGVDKLLNLFESGKKIAIETFDKITNGIKGAFDIVVDALKNLGGAAGDLIKKIPGGNMLLKMLEGIGGTVGKILKKGLRLFKFIPGIGDLVNLYFAYERFQEGDYIGSLLELAGAIPGFGIIADFYLLYRDFTTTEEERKQQNTSVGDFFKGLARPFKKAWENIKKHPFVKGCMDVIEGGKKILNGDVVAGLRLMAKGAYHMSPVGMVFDSAIAVYDWLMGSSNESAEVFAGESVESLMPEKFDLVSLLKDAVVEKLKSMTKLVKNIISKPVEWAKSLWSSITSYFASDDEIKSADKAEAAIKEQTSADNLPKPKNATGVLNQITGTTNDNALMNLLNDLKKVQIDKADLQVKKIETTNRLLENIIVIMKEFRINEPKGTSSKNTPQFFALQSTASNMLANTRSAGYAI